MTFFSLILECAMKQKTIKVGTIKDSDLNKKIRKPLPPPSFRHKSKKNYNRKKIDKNYE